MQFCILIAPYKRTVNSLSNCNSILQAHLWENSALQAHLCENSALQARSCNFLVASCYNSLGRLASAVFGTDSMDGAVEHADNRRTAELNPKINKAVGPTQPYARRLRHLTDTFTPIIAVLDFPFYFSRSYVY